MQIQEYKRKYVHEVLVIRLVKLAQEKVLLVAVRLDMIIAVDWDVKHQNKQIKTMNLDQTYRSSLIKVCNVGYIST